MTISPRLKGWLLRDSDPSVQLRVLTSVLGRPSSDPAVVEARGRIGREGWARRILDEQLPGGQWATPKANAGSLYLPKYIATNWRLIVLAELGMSGRDRRVRKAVELYVRTLGKRGDSVFSGAGAEACITGNAVRFLLLFGEGHRPEVDAGLRWIVRHQKPDGGWHCFPSRRGTLDAWEPLAALAELPPADRTPAVRRAIERGAEFFLERRLFREGKGTYAPWFRLHYPTHYYYDLLVGLTMLVRLGYADDPRLRPALDRLIALRNRDGSWNVDRLHPDVEGPGYAPRRPFYPVLLEMPGRPSRWVTAGALSVLRASGRL